ncbi:MAG: tetratricopeptide repeat protein [Aggregatilineales bacterium]
MLESLPIARQTQERLAQHYLKKLQQANNAMTQIGVGNRSYWIKTIQQDWLQIKHWRDWSAMAEQTERARLCVDFCTTTVAATSTQQTTLETIDILQQGLQAARLLNDWASEGEILYMLGLNHLRLQQMAETRSCAEALMGCGEKLQDGRMIGRAWYLLACVSNSSGDFATAETQYTRSRELLEAVDPKEMVAVWAGFGHVAYFQGNYQESYDYHSKSMEQALLVNDEPNAAVAHLSLAGVCLQLKDVQQALLHAQSTLSISRKLSFLPLIPYALTMLANVNRQLGQLDEARAYYEEVLGITRATLSFNSIIMALTGLGRVYILQGDDDSAIIHFVDALKMAQENNIAIRISSLSEELFRIYLSRGDISRAHEYLEALVASAMALNTPRFYAKTVFAVATMKHSEGDSEQAAQWIGLLQQHAEHLDPNHFSEFSDALQATLGDERYAQAMASGQSLMLDDIMRDLSDKL